MKLGISRGEEVVFSTWNLAFTEGKKIFYIHWTFTYYRHTCLVSPRRLRNCVDVSCTKNIFFLPKWPWWRFLRHFPMGWTPLPLWLSVSLNGTDLHWRCNCSQFSTWTCHTRHLKQLFLAVLWSGTLVNINFKTAQYRSCLSNHFIFNVLFVYS